MILRIDVNHAERGRNYSIPPDNPFVNRGGRARPEIWAYGLRNIWRMAFDRQTGKLWAADVGQDQWEEINIVVRGGNYGWSLREGSHHFQGDSDHDRNLIEPLWEYGHDVGKSITGGAVYRGRDIPELFGHYVYADYVSGRIQALRYDEEAGQVLANRTIPRSGPPLPILSFGEDEQGELYFLVATTTGRSLFKLVRQSK